MSTRSRMPGPRLSARFSALVPPAGTRDAGAETSVSRRAVGVGAVTGLVLLTGCGGDPETAARSSTLVASTPTTTTAAEPDQELVLEVLEAERAVLGQLEDARATQRSLRARLAPPVRVHRAHVALLAGAVGEPGADASAGTEEPPGAQTTDGPIPFDGATPDTEPPTTTPPGSESPDPRSSGTGAVDESTVLARLSRAEQALVDRHTRTAVAATSGTLARVFAGMAAAAAQQAVVLDRLAAQATRRPGADR